MSETPNLALPLVAAAQAQKHVTVNEALALLDAAVGLTLAGVAATAPPGSPVEGACHFVPAGASGAWAGEDGNLAFYLGGGWTFRTPRRGTLAFIADEDRLAIHVPPDGWPTARAVTAHGAATVEAVIEEDVALAGAAVDTTIAIPGRALVLAVSTRTVTAVTGATSYDCGTAAEPSKFGGLLDVAAGAANVGVVGPTAYYAATPIRLTANGGAFTGGVVRVAIHLLCFVPPAA